LNKEQFIRFHHALGDPVRCEMLRLLSSGWHTGSRLAKKLGISQTTASYHLGKLRAADILDRDRWGTEVYFRLSPQKMRSFGQDAAEWILSGGPDFSEEPTAYFAEDGKLLQWPAKRADQYAVLKEICMRLEADAVYGDDAMYAFMKGVYADDPGTIIGAGMHHWMFARVTGGYLVQPEGCWRK